MVNRRQFFSGFWKPKPKTYRTPADRKARYQGLETHVEIELLPNDFALTEKEGSYLRSRIRSFLEETSDEELFSMDILRRLRQLVEDVIEPWRMASAEVSPIKQPEELRRAAVEKVTVFLNNVSAAQIDTLKARFESSDRTQLATLLKREIKTWVDQMEDREILKHDAFSIQEPVFAHLHRLCE